jgi:calcium-dependent protein kinase
MVEAISHIHTLGYSHDELTIDSFSIFDEINSTPFIKLTDIRSIFQFMYPKNSILYEPPNSHSH